MLITSKSMLGAYKHGWNDCMNGLKLKHNPYELEPNPRSYSTGTFSKEFWTHWIYGFSRAESYKGGCEEYPIQCPCVYWEYNNGMLQGNFIKRIDKDCKWCHGNGILE